ncbi:MAG: hypothetical protein ACC628_19085 [Pirellulaceae bacterium]
MTRRRTLRLETLEQRMLLAVITTDGFIDWDTVDKSLFIDTNTTSPDKVAVSAVAEGSVTYVQVTYNINTTNGSDTTTKVNNGSGGFVETKDVESLEIKTDRGDDEIDVSGVTASNGYLAKKLDGKIELKGQKDNDQIIGSEFDDILEGRQGNDTITCSIRVAPAMPKRS